MNLSETWFAEGYVDFELQKYKLLAYLQEVNKYFDQAKLYPQLADVIFHFNNLNSFSDNKRFLQDQFPKRLDKLNIEKLELVYEQMLADSEMMQELENIVQFSLAKLKTTIDNGTEIYEFVEQKLHMEPVGIMPLYKNEGYLLLRYGSQAEVRAYAYSVTLFEHKDARYRGLHMSYVDSWTGSLVHTYESIKKEIIHKLPHQPNPAVYSLETSLQFPLDETLLPIAKRMLVRQLDGVH